MPVDELQRVLDRLPDARANGTGYHATCPSHDPPEEDSLFISVDEKGRLVLRCVRCTRKQILTALAAIQVAGPGVPQSEPEAVVPRSEMTTESVSPIWSLDAEQAVLGAILLDQTALATTKAVLEPTHFYREAHRRLYTALMEIDAEGQRTDAVVVLDYLRRNELLHAVGGHEAIAELVDAVPTAANVAFHARIVAEYAQRRNFQAILTQTVRDLSHGATKIPEVQQILREACDQADQSTPDTLTAVLRLDEILADENLMRPPTFVVPYLVQDGRCTLFSSAEKAGKSTMTGYMAAQVTRGAEFLGEPCARGDVLIIALEEHVGDLARRLQHFAADPKRIFVIRENPGQNLHARLSVIRRRVTAIRPTLLIVDTLMAYVDGLISDANAAAQMQPIVQGITTLAHDTNTSVVLVHHAKKSDGTYRDSSAIGGGVDVIAEMFTPDEDSAPNMRVIRRKGRGVSQAVFECLFDGRIYTLNHGRRHSPEDRVLAFVEANPGCSKSQVRLAMKGQRYELTDQIIRKLLATNALENKGRGSTWSLSVSDHRRAAGLSDDANTRAEREEWNLELDS